MKTIEFTINQKELIEFKKRRYVRAIVSNALEKGILKRPGTCDLCASDCRPQAHHVDYGDPLRIIWLCRDCHGLVHRKEHVLNPKNNAQTPLPACVKKYNSVTVSFQLPIRNFLAIHAEAEKKGKSISEIIREKTLEKFPVQKQQLEFNFEDEKNGISQSVNVKGIQMLAKNQGILQQPERKQLPKLWSERYKNVQGMARQLSSILG